MRNNLKYLLFSLMVITITYTAHGEDNYTQTFNVANEERTLDKNVIINMPDDNGNTLGILVKSNSANSKFLGNNKKIEVNSLALQIPKPEKNERGLDKIADAYYQNIPISQSYSHENDEISVVGVGALLGYIYNPTSSSPYVKNKLNTTNPNIDGIEETQDDNGNRYIYIDQDKFKKILTMLMVAQVKGQKTLNYFIEDFDFELQPSDPENALDVYDDFIDETKPSELTIIYNNKVTNIADFIENNSQKLYDKFILTGDIPRFNYGIGFSGNEYLLSETGIKVSNNQNKESIINLDNTPIVVKTETLDTPKNYTFGDFSYTGIDMESLQGGTVKLNIKNGGITIEQSDIPNASVGTSINAVGIKSNINLNSKSEINLENTSVNIVKKASTTVGSATGIKLSTEQDFATTNTSNINFNGDNHITIGKNFEQAIGIDVDAQLGGSIILTQSENSTLTIDTTENHTGTAIKLTRGGDFFGKDSGYLTNINGNFQGNVIINTDVNNHHSGIIISSAKDDSDSSIFNNGSTTLSFKKGLIINDNKKDDFYNNPNTSDYDAIHITGERNNFNIDDKSNVKIVGNISALDGTGGNVELLNNGSYLKGAIKTETPRQTEEKSFLEYIKNPEIKKNVEFNIKSKRIEEMDKINGDVDKEKAIKQTYEKNMAKLEEYSNENVHINSGLISMTIGQDLHIDRNLGALQNRPISIDSNLQPRWNVSSNSILKDLTLNKNGVINYLPPTDEIGNNNYKKIVVDNLKGTGGMIIMSGNLHNVSGDIVSLPNYTIEDVNGESRIKFLGTIQRPITALSGNETAYLNSISSDTLHINKSSEGHHYIYYKNKADAKTTGNDSLLVVSSNKKNPANFKAEFSILNKAIVLLNDNALTKEDAYVELGGFLYKIGRAKDSKVVTINDDNINNWYLFPVTKDDKDLNVSNGSQTDNISTNTNNTNYLPLPTPGAQTGISIGQSLILLNKAENSSILNRLGDIHNSNHSLDIWATTYNGRYHSKSTPQTSAYKNIHWGVTVGTDRKSNPTKNISVYNGAFIGLTRNYDRYKEYDGKTSTNGMNIGLYSTWISTNEWYLDLVGRYSNYKTRANVTNYSDETVLNHKIKTHTLSGSVKTGKRFYVSKDKKWYLEPNAGLDYTKLYKFGYTTSNGLDFKSKKLDSLVGSIGIQGGIANILTDNKNINLYVKYNFEKEFKNKGNYSLNGVPLSINFGDNTQRRYGAGFSVDAINKGTSVYLEIEKTDNRRLERNYQINAGIKYSF